MNFASDNVTPVCPEIQAAIDAQCQGNAPAYGGDDVSATLDHAFSDLFEREVAVIPVSTGTAANCISLSTLVSPYGGIVCHHEAHINEDESTAVAHFTGGAKLLPIDGPAAKLEAATLSTYLESRVDRGVHSVTPECVAVTQSTELGGVYNKDEITAIGDVCRQFDKKLFMDGARFANAVAALDCSPADITWKAGVNALSFGGTKNGALAVEAIILFDTSLREKAELARKRSGHLLSKHRYLAAQLAAYIQDDLWLKNARNANEAARELAILLKEQGGELLINGSANELFVSLPDGTAARLRECGLVFYNWPSLGRQAYRFVTAWNSDIDAIQALKTRLQHG
ncbi:low specificity L-threonine aldolase [Thalassospira sp. TSL5-1]|uniref:threonine aldolase family protein n=1 Tax=Thalassospira sp. TSL5-1 TaxID=1544451 RepID=UPI00093DC24D|nr:beta-eliminating lyase-related protein [Thalassospira sp. TSL5-1]OKH88937.1 threonine aldolase [Thalassospira sp. TSL5-1]